MYNYERSANRTTEERDRLEMPVFPSRWRHQATVYNQTQSSNPVAGQVQTHPKFEILALGQDALCGKEYVLERINCRKSTKQMRSILH